MFGKERVVPRLYAEASDIRRDFLTYVGAEHLTARAGETNAHYLNTSPSLEALEYIRVFRQMEPDVTRRTLAQRALFRHFTATGHPASRLLSTTDRRQILNHYRSGNERFFAEYFATENRFDPDKLLSGEASERVTVDTSDAADLVEELLAAKSAAPPASPPL